MHPDRYHVTLVLAGRPALHGWWGSEPIARAQFTGLVGRYGQPGTRITLVDEETGATLTEWPETS
ncbi:hypothetical protein GCM10010293_41220 [Streptomyces griseoflavus]|uniref:hypothetical protein n=1 Tax=Streptomyces griseoflavus TaxID=35619 RepID=UPI00167DDD30|nr:hypothetical protein [Streptomyces griseoflavus]GGV37412.1 hypothetical protein GCM10010293_41220 [Streptomyces griseoflavus]